MNKLLLSLAALVLASAASAAQPAMTQLQNCANADCGWSRDTQSLPPDATGSWDADRLNAAALAPTRQTYVASSTPPRPTLTSRAPERRSGGGLGRFIIPGLLAAGGGYLGYAGILPFSIGGPWVMAAVGAAIGLAIAFFVIPKILSLFRRRN